MTLSQAAYEKILEYIITGKYKPGSPLKEEELANILKMSRTPVREALARLEKEGIITKNGKLYIVTPLTETDVVHLYEIRIGLEPYIAKLAAIRATQDEIERMLEILSEIKNSLNSDPLALANLNGNLHGAIAKASHNKYAAEILENIRLKLKIVRVTLFVSFQRRNEEIKEHESIVMAIKDRNPDLAYELMKSHEENVLDYVEKNVIPLIFK